MRRGAGLACALTLAALPAPAIAQAPQVQAQTSIPPAASGWFTAPVTVTWKVTGTITPPLDPGCSPTEVSQDTKSTVLSCRAANGSESTTGTIEIRLDQTPPTNVAAAASRLPDAGTWYTAPVDLTWSGVDAASGIASCTAMTYAGPDGSPALPSGTCSDLAGNVSAPVVFPLAFDATPPALSGVAAAVSGTAATVRWTPGGDAVSVSVSRTPGDRGAPDKVLAVAGGARQVVDRSLARGKAYTWTVTVRDAAGNATTATVSAKVPRRAAAASRVLRWRAAPGADYYNVQLFRGGRKILSTWPRRARLRLHRSWRFLGRRERLAKGRYHWYVWPGYGPRAQRRYGRLLAHGTLRVR